MRAHLLILTLLLTFDVAAQPAASSSGDAHAGQSAHPGSAIVVDIDTIAAAMREELALGYATSATTNSARFFSGVVLRLARNAQSVSPAGPPLLIKHQSWHGAYLRVTGLSAEQAPLNLRRIYENRQDALIDYNVERVIKSVNGTKTPEIALSVQIYWPRTEGGQEQYSFDDTTATPTLRVTNHRLIRYRMLDFGNMIAFDDMTGLTGRPTSGVFAPLFAVIGEGRITWSRFSVTDDGLQVMRAQARKGPFKRTETVSVYPDGTAKTGLPEDSAHLLAIDERLRVELDIEYHDWFLPDVAAPN